jgi:hypothetical protein
MAFVCYMRPSKIPKEWRMPLPSYPLHTRSISVKLGEASVMSNAVRPPRPKGQLIFSWIILRLTPKPMHAVPQSPIPSAMPHGIACGDLVVWVCRHCGSRNVYRAFNVQCCMDCAQAVCADGRDQIAVAPLKNGAEPVTPRRATGLIPAGQSSVHSPHNALHELPPPCGSECTQDAHGG